MNRLALAALVLWPALSSAQLPAQNGNDPKQAFAALRYRFIGPYRGGRVTAVAGHAGQPSTFYFGATGGGVWKTTDYGQSWAPVADGQIETGSIGAIDVADSDPSIVYVGTGSAAIRSNVIIGKGVYKSIDAGKTWRQVGLREVGQIGSINVHPTNPNIVWVAALGSPFGKSPHRGVYRTKDGGASWQKVLFLSDSVGAVDIAVNPANPDELYAGMWRAERKPWTIISGGHEGGIYKSTNGGDTWSKLTNGLPRGMTGKNSISIARSNPSRVYVLIEAVGDENGVYRSDDGGATWQHVSNQAGLTNRQFYYTYIDADPKNPDKVWVNNEGFYVSMDGGRSWQRRNTPHGDNHGMWINPDQPDVFIQSNDGGANVTRDGGLTWSPQSNQPTAELYQVDVDQRWPYNVYGAQQDNTTVIQPSGGGAFRVGPGCETGPIMPHRLQPDTVYGACKGHFSRMSMKTGQEKEYPVSAMNIYGHNPKQLPLRFQRVAPMEISPHEPNTIYFGSQFVHRTRDEGVTWETISPDLTANDPRFHMVSGGPITRDVTGEEYYPVLYEIAESKKEPGVIWVGANDGPIHITRDNGKTWKNVTPRMPPGGRVQTIEPSPHTPGKAYAAVLRYQFDDFKPYIFRTTDYGQSWTAITAGIPGDYPVRVVREDPKKPGLLLAGTEFGMFVSFDDGASWQRFQQNLPVTPITDLVLHNDDIVLSTMGRGFWIADNISALRQYRPNLATVTLFAPADAVRLRSAVGSLPRGTVIDYYLPEATESEVVIEVLDASGQPVRRYSSAAAAAPAAPPAPQPMMQSEDEGGRRGGGAPPVRVTRSAGLNRIVWDFSTQRNNRPGPIALPGNYTVRLTVNGTAHTQPLRVVMDPRAAADGVTLADLAEQAEFHARVLDLQAQARDLSRDVRAARDRLREVTRSDAAAADRLRKLDEIDAKLNDQSGIRYPQPMLIGQLNTLVGFINSADMRIGRSTMARTNELAAQLAALRVEFQRLQERD